MWMTFFVKFLVTTSPKFQGRKSEKLFAAIVARVSEIFRLNFALGDDVQKVMTANRTLVNSTHRHISR